MIVCLHYFVLVQVPFILKNKIFVFHVHIQNGEDQSIAGDRNSRLDTIHEIFEDNARLGIFRCLIKIVL